MSSSWTLTITDNADGTGGVAAMTGPPLTSFAFQYDVVSASSRAGFVSLPTVLTTDAGGECLVTLDDATLGSVTGVYYFQITDLSLVLLAGPLFASLTEKGDSIYERCFTMLQDRIRSLNLPGIADEQIYVREIPDLGPNMSVPCILLTDFGNAEQIRGGTNLQDDYGYGISVAIIDRKSAQSDANRPRFLHWRERIHRAIDNAQRFDLRVPEVWKCEVVPAEVVNADWAQQFDLRLSAMLVTCTARQLRRTA